MRIPWSIIWRTSCLASGSRQTAQPLSRFLVGACEQSSARPDGSAPFQSLYQLARRASSNGQAGSVKSQRCGVFSRRSPLDSWRSQTFSHSFSTTKTLDRSSAKLPNDYDPDKGLPFRKKDLTKEEVAAVFGPTIDPALANEVLRVQHGRRLAGILEATSVELPSSSSYSPDFPEQALAWLRKNVPVDEEAILAAMVREEEQRREKVLADRAEQLGLYKPQEDIQINGPGRQSKSGLDLIREQNEARLDALERERDEKLKKQAQVNPAGTKQLSWRYADLSKSMGIDSSMREMLTRYTASSSGLQTNPEWVEAQRKGAVTTSKAAPDMSKVYTAALIKDHPNPFSDATSPAITPRHSPRSWSLDNICQFLRPALEELQTLPRSPSSSRYNPHNHRYQPRRLPNLEEIQLMGLHEPLLHASSSLPLRHHFPYQPLFPPDPRSFRNQYERSLDHRYQVA
jgi:hypothetical protein